MPTVWDVFGDYIATEAAYVIVAVHIEGSEAEIYTRIHKRVQVQYHQLIID